MNSGLSDGLNCTVTLFVSSKVAVAVVSAVVMWIKLGFDR
jgi:hypothetical protein